MINKGIKNIIKCSCRLMPFILHRVSNLFLLVDHDIKQLIVK